MTTMTPGGGGPTIDPAQPGLFIFTEGYYSAVYSLGADLRLDLLWPIELAVHWEVEGNKLTIVVAIATGRGSLRPT